MRSFFGQKDYMQVSVVFLIRISDTRDQTCWLVTACKVSQRSFHVHL